MNSLERLLLLLRDPVFWVATVLLGLVLSILANYLTRGFDRWLASRRARTEGQKTKTSTAYALVAAHLADNPRERFNLRLDVLYFGQQSLFWALCSLVSALFAVSGVILIAQGFPVWVFVGPYVSGMFPLLMFVRAMSRQRRALRAVRAYKALSGERSYDDVLEDALA